MISDGQAGELRRLYLKSSVCARQLPPPYQTGLLTWRSLRAVWLQAEAEGAGGEADEAAAGVEGLTLDATQEQQEAAAALIGDGSEFFDQQGAGE